MALAVNHPFDEVVAYAHSPSVGGTPITARTIAPFRGKITKISTNIYAAISTADGTATTSIAGVAVTGGVVTITQAASAAGQVNSTVPSGANTVNEGDDISIAFTGATGATVACTVAVQIRRT